MIGEQLHPGSPGGKARRWRPIEPPFLMPINAVGKLENGLRSASGRVERGKLYQGELVRIVGSDHAPSAVVSEIEVLGEQRDEAHAGNKVTLLLRGVDSLDLRPGLMLTVPRQHPGPAAPRPHFGAELYLARREGGAWKRIVA